MSRRSALTTLLLMLSVAAHTARSEPAATRTDHHGDPLPPGAVARLGTVRLRHVGGIRALAFSPDGKRLASGSDARNDDRTLRLWDVRTGKEIFRRTDSGRSFVRIAFSPDGKTLATGGDHGNVILWDAGTGKRRRDLSVDQSSIDELAFTPDGRRLIVGGEGQGIGLWDVSTGKELKQLQGSFSTVALSHDGKTLAAVGPKQSLQFWDVAIGTERKHLSDMKGRIRRIALSPDGKAIAFIGKDHTLRLLDVSTGKDIRPLKKNEACRDDVVFSPDEQFLAAGGKDSVRVWQLSSGDPLPPFRNARLESCAFAFSPDSKVLAVTDIDHVIHFWELSTGKDLSPVGEEPAEARSLSFSADGATVSMRSGEWSLDQWETASWIKRRRFRLPFTEARPEEVCLVASPDGKTVASSSAEAVIHLHDWATGRERAVLRHRTPVSNVQFSGDGRLLISWSGAKARLWETATGRAIQSFSYRDGPPGAFTSEGAF